MCVRFSRFFGICAALVITFALCLSGIDAAAEDVVTYTQWSVNDTLSFFGNSFTGNVTVGGVEYSTTFNYINYDSSNNYIDGINIESNDVINSNSLSSYNILVYKGTVSSLDGSNVRGDIYIPVDIYHSGGLRFFVGSISNLSSSSTLDPSFVGNAISTNPANMISLSRSPSSASSSDYYNLAHTRIRDTSWGDLTFQSRLLTYNAVDSSISFFRFENIASLGRDFFIFIATPYSYDDVSHDSPVTTTVTTTTDISSSGGSVTIINNNTDLTQTNGLISSVISGLQSLGQSLLSGIEHIFVPEQGYFDNKIAQVKAKFAWYEDIVDAWTEFKTALNNVSADSPPSINVNLDERTFFGQSIGSGSGTALVLDWMITYRNTIRNLLTAFMWIFFLWRLYCHIPNIISGSGMEVQKTDEGAAWTIHGKKL
ncbi:MAG: hypothetical protein IK134_08390 [Oscillospiraceae bacterium]|nr:hypothetical protein [Oscillospiraceae bacterium]